MRLFKRGDRVKLDSALLRYSANKHWVGKYGVVLSQNGSYLTVKWEHLESPLTHPLEQIERV